jgi:hypothetical protein
MGSVQAWKPAPQGWGWRRVEARIFMEFPFPLWLRFVGAFLRDYIGLGEGMQDFCLHFVWA